MSQSIKKSFKSVCDAALAHDTTAINRAGVSDEELAANGLRHAEKNEWSVK